MFFDDADRAADEALAVFHLIMSNVDKDLLVIGNERYGSMFVTDLIKPYLAGGGVKIVNNHGSLMFYVNDDIILVCMCAKLVKP